MQSMRRSALPFGLWVHLITCNGCMHQHAAQHESTLPRHARLTVHDAGRVLAGTTIRHTFHFANPLDEPVHLASDADLQMSCGCTVADLVRHRLKPGQTTPLRVSLNTAGRQGRVREVVSLTWTTANRQRHEFAFAVQAEVRVALTLVPAELSFTKDEVAQGVKKRIECGSDLPLDWANARLEAHALGLSIERGRTADGRLSFEVTCEPSHAVDHCQGAIRISAHRLQPDEPPPHAAYTATLPVFWTAPLPFRVSPAMVTLWPDKTAAEWRGSFVISGDLLLSERTLTDVQIPDGKVWFRSTRLGSSAERIEARLKLSKPGSRPRRLDLVLSNGERRFVRILYAKHKKEY